MNYIKKVCCLISVKILVPNKPRNALIVAFDNSNSFGNWPRRTKSSSELLWNMIMARKSNKIELSKMNDS